MIKVVAKILIGAVNRLKSKPSTGRYPAISFSREKILKHQDQTSVKEIGFPEFRLFYRQPYEVLHTYDEIFRKEIYRFKPTQARPVILDCGAYIGQSVIYFKKEFPAAELMAFEPDTAIFEILKRNVEENGLKDVTLHRAAVWTTNGSISFEAKGSEGSHIAEEGATDTISVPCMRLADIIAGLPVIDFLKMDIEGAEFAVMNDCAPYLSKVQNLFLEYHGTIDQNQELITLLEIVQKAGFSFYIRQAADVIVSPFIQKRSGLPFDLQLNIFCYRKD